MPLLVQQPTLGLNGLIPDSQLEPREAAQFTQNIIYERGLAQTSLGFAKLDLTSGLNSGDIVLSVLPFKELDGFGHLVAVTRETIQEHDRANNDWNDKTQSGKTMSSVITKPVTFAAVGHSSSITLNDVIGATSAFYHLIICDGGNTDIQRWAGRFETDFADLVGAGGYHDGTTHRAQAIGSTRNRLILISPQTFSSTSNLWTENNQTIRWPVINKIETWTGTGSGAVTLIDTGGVNLVGTNLGGTFIIYQDRGIWDLNWVGGTTVFDPRPMISDLGLLAPHLLVAKNNIHYFVGDDFNVYAYLGGTIKQRIGDKIHRYLQEQLDPDYAHRSWLAIDKDNKRLWIFIVPKGDIYITKAYGMDLVTGSWMPRDFADVFSTNAGITAVSLIGSETFITGESYIEALNSLSGFAADVSQGTAGDVTRRYGDELTPDTTTAGFIDFTQVDATLDFTDVEFSKGGLFFAFSASADPTVILYDPTSDWDGDTADWSTFSGKILRISDGSDSTNMPHGTHYYTMTDISSVDAGAGDFTVKINLAPRDTTQNAAADNSDNTPALNGVGTDTSAVMYDPTGLTYNEKTDDVLVQDRLIMGDATGLVFQWGDETAYDDISIVGRHHTHVEDAELPEVYKQWKGIAIVAKGISASDGTAIDNGGINVRHRIDNFDTSDTGWVDHTVDLTQTMQSYNVWLNTTSKQIQFEFANAAESDYVLSQYKVLDPEILENR